MLNEEERLLLSVLQYSVHVKEDKEKIITHPSIQWEEFYALVIRHRLIPLVYKYTKTLDEIPDSIKECFRQKYKENTQKMLSLTSELIHVVKIFRKNGINIISLKGPLFAKRIYGEFNVRQSRDIDMLIPLKDLQKADEGLKENGYVRISPDFELSKKQYRVNLNASHEYSYKNSKTGNLVELHWRLFTQPLQFPVESDVLFGNAVPYTFSGITCKTLSNQHLLLYLLVHGSVHNWFRLFWLHDIAYFIQNQEIDYSQLILQAKKYGIERSVVQGLVVSHYIMGTRINKDIWKHFIEKRTIQKMVRGSIKAIFASEKYNVTSKIARIHKPVYLMKLRKEVSYKVNCFVKLKTNASDWRIISLPDGLFFLYYLLRPFTWFYNAYIKRAKTI